jgi:hypothetical protein
MSPESSIKVNLVATPVYYQNMLNLKSYAGYSLHQLSLKKDSSSLADNELSQELSNRDLTLFPQNSAPNFNKFAPLEVSVDPLDNFGDLIKNLANGNLREFKDIAQAIGDEQGSAFSLLFRFTLSENIS